MLSTFWDELSTKGITVLIGLVLGAFFTWLWTRWKRIRERQSVLSGDARDTIVIAYHIVETIDAPPS